MRHTFDKDTVLRIVTAAAAADEPVMLAGDHGVYLCTSALKKDDGEGLVVAYANEVNPDTMEFDAWWDAKDRGFGGDDGAAPIDPADLVNLLYINVTRERMEIVRSR